METTEQKILVWNAKFGSEYFDASTPEIWAESCLKVASAMNDMGYYYLEELEQEESDEVIASLPESYRTEATKRKLQISRANEETRRRNANVEALLEAIESHDVSLVTIGQGRHQRIEPAVWHLLRDRRSREYENVTIETVWSPPKA